LFAVEIACSCLFDDMFRLNEIYLSNLLEICVSRSSDKIGTVRTKALSSLAKIIGHLMETKDQFSELIALKLHLSPNETEQTVRNNCCLFIYLFQFQFLGKFC